MTQHTVGIEPREHRLLLLAVDLYIVTVLSVSVLVLVLLLRRLSAKEGKKRREADDD